MADGLDAVNKIAERFDDAELAKKSKEVRGLTAQFGKFYDEGVAAIKANDAVSTLMWEKGTAVQNELQAYLTAKKTELIATREYRGDRL